MAILFYGDSITDVNKSYSNPLGLGYVSFLDKYFKETLINEGISGNTSRDLVHRLKQDVLSVKPKKVYLMIGINDVWQHFKSIYEGHTVSTAEYKENIETIMEHILREKIDLVVLLPFYLNKDENDPMVALTKEYQTILKDVSKAYKVDVINLQKEMDTYLESHDVSTISDDFVHVFDTGHEIIKESILKYEKKTTA